MNSREMTRDEFDAILLERIANGEITAEAAESEWDFFVNGFDSYETIYGW